MKKLKPSSYNTNKWSGGETTELLIYPEESSFKARDFKYRLSIATIEVSSSDFTPLPETQRTLLLLEGELKLIHENHHESFLMPFSQDTFDGGWNTHSIGIAKDFNLMTKGLTKGIIHVINYDFQFDSIADQIICYNYDANVKIENEEIGNYDVQFFSTTGQLILQTSIQNNNQKEIDVSNFPNGIYHYIVTKLENQQKGYGKIIRLK